METGDDTTLHALIRDRFGKNLGEKINKMKHLKDEIVRIKR